MDEYYPIIVEGNWQAKNVKSVKNKLQIYFQSKKSQGGDCFVQYDGSNSATILFKSSDIRDGVLSQAEHIITIGNQQIKLKVYKPSTGQKTEQAFGNQEPSRDGMLSRAKNDINTTGHQIESKMCKPSDAEKQADSTGQRTEQACGYQEPTAGKFLEDSRTHEKFKKNNLRACALERSTCVRVEELPAEATKMLLELYFEKWGGPVEKVITIPSEQAAMITFKEEEANGALKPGDAFITDAGRLPCKYVVHAVGPRFRDSDIPTTVQRLRRAVRESLNQASSRNCSSIGIPVISSGIFGCPLDLCTESIAKEVRDYIDDHNHRGSNSTLTEIHLVDNNDNTVNAMTQAVRKEFAAYNPKMTFPHQIKPHGYSNSGQGYRGNGRGRGRGRGNYGQRNQEFEDPKNHGNRDFEGQAHWRRETSSYGGRSDNSEGLTVLERKTTQEGLKIILSKGNIQDASADVIVNTMSEDLDLRKGAVSNALLQTAGHQLQAEITRAARSKNVNYGEMLITDGYKLKCQKVFHVVCPFWKQGSEHKVLAQIIRNCLKNAENWRMASVVFPAIGTGNLGFPKDLVARIMLTEVQEFNSTNLREVTVIVHPSDKESVECFTSVFRHGIQGPTTKEAHQHVKIKKNISGKSAQTSGVTGKVSSSSRGVHTMQLGQVTLEVSSGDITKEKTDAIVNCSNQTFSLKAGVSKAILDAAGVQVEKECSQIVRSSNTQQTEIVTSAGQLPCGNIIHVIGRSSPSEIKDVVLSVLELCESRQITSVAFPALGTGQGGANPADVADAMVDAVVGFVTKKKPVHVGLVKFLIFQTNMVADFHQSIIRRSAEKVEEDKGLLTKIKDFFWRGSSESPANEEFVIVVEKIEPAVFQLCGETPKDVSEAKDMISSLILREHVTIPIHDPAIAHFTREDGEMLNAMQRELTVSVRLEKKGQDSVITLEGLTRDVHTAESRIRNMIRKVERNENRRSEAFFISSVIQWQYQENGRSVKNFDTLTNYDLEQAYRKRQPSVKIKINNDEYEVDLVRKEATRRGKSIELNRVDLQAAAAAQSPLPSHWEDMKGQPVVLVKLTVGSKEFAKVEKEFRRTNLTNNIIEIERVQNGALWKSYMIKKEELEDKNKHKNNEKLLFHGTGPDKTDQINNHGFNRSFAGMNGAMYGNGSYFAVDPSYSAQGYSAPDAKGHKRMYLVRVLVGDFTQGKQGLPVPPAKSSNNADLYNSVTDNMTNPTIQSRHVDIRNQTDVKKPQETSAVVLENLPEDVKQDILTLLVENISSLSENDFSMELIPGLRKAVVNFKNPSAAEKFLEDSRTHEKFKRNNLRAHALERSTCVRVEELPAEATKMLLELYFEKWGGPVEEVITIPSEQAAMIIFKEEEAKQRVLKQENNICDVPVKIYPYFKSLGTVLYGGNRPNLKLPEPITVSVHPAIREFIIKKGQISSIKDQMSSHFCHINMDKPEVLLSPDPALLKQKQDAIDDWSKNAFDVFKKMISNYTTSEWPVSHTLLFNVEINIKKVVKDQVLIDLDAPKGVLTLAGMTHEITGLKPIIEKFLERGTDQLKREKNSVTEDMEISPAMYSLLEQDGLTSAVSPHLHIDYNKKMNRLFFSGLHTETLAFKNWVLEKKINMKKKHLQINYSILEFLRSVDCDEMSRDLFISHGMTAVYTIENRDVVVIGSTERALKEAEKRINTVLTTKLLVVEDQGVLQMPEWLDLKKQLENLFSTLKKISVLINLSKKRDKVIVTGFRKPVMEVSENLGCFIEKHTKIVEEVHVKSHAVVDFIKDRKSQDWQHFIKSNEVKVSFDSMRPLIKLSGERTFVQPAVTFFKSLADALYTDTLIIKKAGAKKYFMEQGKMMISMLLKEKSFVVVPQDDDMLDAEEDEFTEGSFEDIGQVSCEVQVPGGVTVTVRKEDICKISVDAVVNAANEDLKHTGGVALALLQAAGPSLQQICDQHTKTNGALKPGDAFITDAGRLPCKYVVHAVGPRFSDSDRPTTVQRLRHAVRESLNQASSKNCSSIAIPVISSGIFGCPLDLCTETIAKEADVIVNTISEDLDLRKGAVSNALLQTAGHQLQSEITRAARSKNVNYGEMLITDGYKLKCQKVFHVVCPFWKQGSKDEVLTQIIRNCLKKAESWRMASVVLPAIGTGNLGFPKDLVARIILKEVQEFKPTNLREVTVIVHPSDKESVECFTSIFRHGIQGPVTKEVHRHVMPKMNISGMSAQASELVSKVSSSSRGVHTMQLGQVTLEVSSGDITKEKTDAIVNSSNKTFSLKAGVSKAILDAAGVKVEQECSQIGLGSLNLLFICQAGAKPADVADAMVDAVVGFVKKKKPVHVGLVKFLIFQTNMVADFHQSMIRRSGEKVEKDKGLLTKYKDLSGGEISEFPTNEEFVMVEEDIEPAVFQLCGETPEDLSEARDMINSMILREHVTIPIHDPAIAHFTREDVETLNAMQRELTVSVRLEKKGQGSVITLEGLTRDVHTAKSRIRDIIRKVERNETRKSEAFIIRNVVKWQYQENGRTIKHFDTLTNYDLEQAFQKRQPSIEKVQNCALWRYYMIKKV
ncbi:hypothetical protein cypCar_00021683 [Cyprinus carpio]|nr:hypothetical protein cypCar_00021683 [Cyprinus carpio]